MLEQQRKAQRNKNFSVIEEAKALWYGTAAGDFSA